MLKLHAAVALIAVAAVGSLGCGARTSLLPGEQGSGGATSATSAQTSTSATTSSGAGGAGGALDIVCTALAQDGEPIVSATALTANQHESEPALVAIDANRVMLFRTMVYDNAASTEVWAATFDAWQSWPKDQGPLFHEAAALRDGSMFAPGFGADAIGFFPLFSLGQPDATIPFLAPSLLPQTAHQDLPPGKMLFEISGSSGRPRAVVRGNTNIFLDYSLNLDPATGPLTYSSSTLVDPAGKIVAEANWQSGCTLGPGRGDALAVGGGFLSAFSSGRPWGICLNDDGVIGPGLRVQVERWPSEDSAEPTFGSETVLSEPVSYVRLLERSGGAWLLTQTDGSTSFTYPGVLATPLDQNGAVAGKSLTVVPDGRTPGPIATARLANGIAAVWAEPFGPAGSNLFVRFTSEDGATELETSLFTADASLGPDRLAMVASPHADALLIAWHGTNGQDRLFATRVACVTPL